MSTTNGDDVENVYDDFDTNGSTSSIAHRVPAGMVTT
jgi:hypothetical protein